MSQLSAYQAKFQQRTKRAVRLRSDADCKARAYARLLAAASMMNLLNQTYDVDVSTQTLLVRSLTDKIGAQPLTDIMANGQPGEETVIFNQVPDATAASRCRTMPCLVRR